MISTSAPLSPRGWLALGLGLVSGQAVAGEAHLPPVTVTDELAPVSSRGPGPGWARATDRAGASRTSIGREALDRRGPDRVEQLTGAMPGAHTGRAHGGLSTAVTLRGFDITTPYWNGLPDIDRLFVRDPYTIERVEVLSGPDAILEGVTSPGGSIRYRGKRPQFRSAHEVGVEAGHPDHLRVTADTTGPLGERLAYRVTIAGQDGERRPARLTTEWLHGLAGLTWRYGAHGEVRLEHEYQRNRRPYDMGTVWLEDGPVYDTPLHSPEQESDRQYQRSALYWAHRLTDRWRISARAAHSEVEREELLMGFFIRGEEVPAPAALSGYAADLEDDYAQKDGRLEIDYVDQSGDIGQRWTFGVDIQRKDIDFESAQSVGAYALDPKDPEFPAAGTLDWPSSLERFEHEERARRGAYIASRVELKDRWQVTSGVRYNDYEIRNADEDDPELTDAAQDRALTWQAGVRLDIASRSQVYINGGTGIRPNEGVDRNEDYLPSRESRMAEAGWRLSPGEQQQVRVALYHLEEVNLPQEDEDFPEEDYLVPAGEVEAQGIEGRYDLDTAAWRLAPNIAFQRTRNGGGEDPAQEGNDLVGVPRYLAGLRLAHDLGAYTPLRLTMWYAGEYVGGWYLDEANDYKTDPYAIHNLGATYRWQGGTRLDLRVRNATDERYLAGPRFQGERREIRLGLRYRF